MEKLHGAAAAAKLENLVHRDTQISGYGVDLTVDKIFKLTGPGAVDFGGSEEAAAKRSEITPELQTPDDDYGWWKLPAGTYLIRYNESLDTGLRGIAHVEPHPRLMRAGAYHASFEPEAADGPLETLLVVGDNGVHLTENCRVSTLSIAEPSG